MRSDLRENQVFAGGVAVGIVLAGVTFLSVEAVRRLRTRRACTARVSFIDGVHPPNEVELEVRPAEEANAADPPRLVSEMPEFSPLSQRW
ncbi:MAG: hypothetical protein KF764_26510 [Labilithrix sp.]|nr:hypothetical protein [Labilithrix sp.]